MMNEFIIVGLVLFGLALYSWSKHRDAEIVREAYEKKAEEYRRLADIIQRYCGAMMKGGE